MTPGARVAAAIEIVDAILAGQAAEPAIARWSRASRFAGSKDRAAVRDLVFDALRAKRSLAAQGGAETGRSILLALTDGQGMCDALFSGEGHAPAPPTEDERAALARTPDLTDAEAANLPDWIWPLWQDALGADAMQAARRLRDRAGIFLRVNQSRTTVSDAISALAADGVTAQALYAPVGALEAIDGSRAIRQARAYLDGFVELQDPASQIAISGLPLSDGMRVLDYCAGGGGKALAMADRAAVSVTAHDIALARMADIPARAARAGKTIDIVGPKQLSGSFDLIFVDAQCSGSGTWRRTPDAKWRLTHKDLDGLTRTQSDILARASQFVAGGGFLSYATCSVLTQENESIVERFMQDHPEWSTEHEMRLKPTTSHDGFYLRLLKAPQ